MSRASTQTRSKPGYGTTVEVAAYTGYSAGYLANLRSKGEGPKCAQPGGGRGHKALYLWADVDAWMTSRNQT